jgi:D-glycero-D-manno-heptose 1,7-bisphosphate phosphatase
MSSSNGKPRWIFLDRDGTINVKPAPGEYVTEPDQVRLLEGAGAAIRRLNEAETWVGVVTNQRGIALGTMSARDLEAVHQRLHAELARDGARLDAIYVCPHGKGACTCRKPLPGLLLQAQREVAQMDFTEAVVIGDSDVDIQAGKSVGAATILLDAEGDASLRADHVAPSLAAAVDWLLA